MNSPDPNAGAISVKNEKLEIDAELLPFFKEESTEIFASVERALGEWEANPSDLAPAHIIYRNFHTLKGSANSIGLNPIGRLSHDMEQIMKSILADQLHPDLQILAPAIRTIAVGMQILLQEISPDSCCPRLLTEIESKVLLLRNDLRTQA